MGMTDVLVIYNTVVCEQILGVMTMRKQVQVWMNDSPVKALKVHTQTWQCISLYYNTVTSIQSKQ